MSVFHHFPHFCINVLTTPVMNYEIKTIKEVVNIQKRKIKRPPLHHNMPVSVRDGEFALCGSEKVGSQGADVRKTQIEDGKDEGARI